MQVSIHAGSSFNVHTKLRIALDLYIPVFLSATRIVSSAYFHGMGILFAMQYFPNYIHLSIWSIHKAFTRAGFWVVGAQSVKYTHL